MYLYSLYQLLSVAIQSGEWLDYTILGVWFIASLVLYAGQVRLGSRAMYFLIDGRSWHADFDLEPSIFYLLNWNEHRERNYAFQYGGYNYE